MPKTALVGANTVNGPLPLSVSTRPAALTAVTRVVLSAELTALSMMSLLGYMAAPPTMGLSFAINPTGTAIAPSTMQAPNILLRLIRVLPFLVVAGEVVGLSGSMRDTAPGRKRMSGWLYGSSPMGFCDTVS